jgi:hypothetical protein
MHKRDFHCSAGAWLGILLNCIVYNYLHLQYNTCTHVFDKVSESDSCHSKSSFFSIASFPALQVPLCWKMLVLNPGLLQPYISSQTF